MAKWQSVSHIDPFHHFSKKIEEIRGGGGQGEGNIMT